MKNITKKCSFTEHKEIDAISYCLICKVYMCNKCDNFHLNLCNEHLVIKSNIELSEIFTGYCKEDNHQMKLDYFCKDHNILCCAGCISKIKNKSDGKHKDCNVCIIEDIQNEKINKLNENIKYLQNLSNTLKESINNLKILFEKICENKEELKLKIQKIFTKIRNELNKREDKLLTEVDKIFDDTFFSEEIIKRSEKLPTQIKKSQEIIKKIDQLNNNDYQLYYFINDCINIENNIKDINNIDEIIKKYNNSKIEKIIFYPEEEDEINAFINNNIEAFGCIKNDELFKSSIIGNDFKAKLFIINGIEEIIKKNNVKLSLIFRMSEIGDKSEDFHNYCDNKGPNLVLIKTTNNKIFGGFTPLNWDKKGDLILDKLNQTFIFTINNMKIINAKNNGYKSIKCQANSGPIFGDWDFGLRENLRIGISYATSKSSFLTENNLELTGSKGKSENFETNELEVYKVIY